MKVYGVDLSYHNGNVDFEKIKAAGNDFVILRAGYGTSTEDSQFNNYYRQAKEAGLDVGAYWYSYALNTDESIEEAKKCLSVIKGKVFEYPIYLDMEDSDNYKRNHGMPSDATLVDICNTFCREVEQNGYYVGIYASESWFDNQLKGLNSGRYDEWVANWGSNNGVLQSDKSSSYRMHQFTSMYSLDGKRYDRDVCYYDYPKVIKDKGLNGMHEQTPVPDTKYKLGDVVTINGVYSSSTSNQVLTPLKMTGKITRIIPDARNPYLLDNGNLGWVNDQVIVNGETYKVGAKIKIKKNSKDLNTHTKYASFVYNKTYVIQAIGANYIVFGPSVSGQATGKVEKSDVILL